MYIVASLSGQSLLWQSKMAGTLDKDYHSERCSFDTFDIIDLGAVRTHINFRLAMSDTKNKLHNRRPKSKQNFYGVFDIFDL
jgi:hypothetical protein